MLGTWTRAETTDRDNPLNAFGEAARAYFDPHPHPKPWADAKAGEVWVFEIEGQEMIIGLTVAAVFGVEFRTVTGKPLSVDKRNFTGARRIWPGEKK